MTDADDHTFRNDEAVLERLLSGDAPSPHAPAWCSDLALVVLAARAPGRPDELAAEDDIVRRMREVRLAVTSGGPAGDLEVDGPEVDVDHPVPDAVDPPPLVSAIAAGAPAPGVADLDAYRARHVRDRTYHAKHAAARLEASRHPAVRTLGRVIAMKAAAVTTVAVIGVAAAAAATTGIVATVVVPALTSNAPHDRAPAPTTTDAQRSGTAPGAGGPASGSADEPSTVSCAILSACTPTTDAGAATAPGSTTVPPTTATSVPRDDAAATPTPDTPIESTVTTTATTTTTAPEPATTTTVPDPPPEDPTTVGALSDGPAT